MGDTSTCVIPDRATGTKECSGGDCDPFKEVTKSSADVETEKTAVCKSFTGTTKSSCEQGIQDKEDAKDKKLSDKMKECVATTNGKTFTGDVAAKKIAKDADAKSCRDKVIDEAVGEAAAIGDFINKDELTQKAERDYDQQDRIADAKNPDTICSRLAVGSAALTKCTKCRVTDVAAIAVLDTAIAGMPTSTDEEKVAKVTKVAAKATKEAECSNTKDPKGALMACLTAIKPDFTKSTRLQQQKPVKPLL